MSARPAYEQRAQAIYAALNAPDVACFEAKTLDGRQRIVAAFEEALAAEGYFVDTLEPVLGPPVRVEP